MNPLLISILFQLWFALNPQLEYHIAVSQKDSVLEMAIDIFDSSLPLHIWQEDNATIFVHRLLGTQPDYQAKNLMSAWLQGIIRQDDIRMLHRGEFLSLLAFYKFEPRDQIEFSDGTMVSVQEIIDYETQIFTLSPDHFFNDKEQFHGQEFGWTLKGFTYYSDVIRSIRGDLDLTDIAIHMMQKGVNRNIEEGCHDLEALAYLRSKLTQVTGHDSLVVAIHNFLLQKAQQVAEELDPSGQAYAGSPHFDGSKLNCASTFCRVLDQLNRQSHFIEWLCDADLIHLFLDDQPVILNRYIDLLQQGKMLIQERLKNNPSPVQEDILIVSSLSHAVSAAKKLSSKL